MPKVDKVVFVGDRIALTKQTNENYKAYDPDATEDTFGSVQNTDNTTVISSAKMRELFSRHCYGLQDLDDTGQIRDIIAQASADYQTLAHDEEVQSLPTMKYRNGLCDPIYKLADELVEN